MAQLTFDPNQVEDRDRIELLPKGRYVAIITDSDVIPTKDGTGQRLKLEYTVQEPAAFKGRKVWNYLNIKNKSPKAEQIGQQQLKEVLVACGIANAILRDTVQMHNRRHVIDVVVVVDDGGQYPDKNEVKGSYPLAGSQAAAPAAAPFQRPAAPVHQPAAQMAQQPPAGHPANDVIDVDATETRQAPASAPAAPAGAAIPPWMKRH